MPAHAETTPDHYVLLDGWQHRRLPGHWQGWLAERLVETGASVDYLTLPDPENPRYDQWSAAVMRALAGHNQVTVVAHGLTALLWLQMCGDSSLSEQAPLARRAILVAPPAAGLHGGDVSKELGDAVTPESVQRAAEETTLLVYSLGDPYLPDGAGSRYGDPLHIESVAVPGGQHLNQASGFGPWPAMLSWCVNGSWPTGAVALEMELDRVYQPDGRRLGIIAAGDVSMEDIEVIERAIRSHDLEPARRLARLQPRVGEATLRAEDVSDFATKYGHEYSVVVIDSGLGAHAADKDDLETACAAAGCTVFWSNNAGLPIL